MKSFTIAVTGRTVPVTGTYFVEGRNKKEAKKKAIELFNDNFGGSFDIVSTWCVWEHKTKNEVEE